jgi:hypothetical protein
MTATQRLKMPDMFSNVMTFPGKEMFSYPFDIEYDNIYAADNE